VSFGGGGKQHCGSARVKTSLDGAENQQTQSTSTRVKFRIEPGPQWWKMSDVTALLIAGLRVYECG